MRFCYINTENIYPQDKHLIDGLKELGHEVFEICENFGKNTHRNLEKKLVEDSRQYDATIIGFTSPILVLIARKAKRGKLIFNAVLTQYEANIISRKDYGVFFMNIAKWWVLDFISFHLSWKILLESDAQIEFVHRYFFVPRKKLIRSFSGLDEKQFFFDLKIKKNLEFTVLFRGRFLPESGILTVVKAAKKLENTGIKFLVIGHGFMYKEFNSLIKDLSPKNLEHIHDRLDSEKLRSLMLSSHISLGQLAIHSRLNRTLPCKLFESLALKLPYITGRNRGVREILVDKVNCIEINPGDSDDLSDKIVYLKNNPEMCSKIGDAGYDLYRNRLTSKILAQEVIDACFKLKQ